MKDSPSSLTYAMKTFFFVLITSLGLSISLAQTPPRLSLSDAAITAETFLRTLQFGDNAHLRSLVLEPSAGAAPSVYIAHFEPNRVTPGDQDQGSTNRFQVIVVSMDGTAKLEERTTPESRVIRRTLIRSIDAPTQ